MAGQSFTPAPMSDEDLGRAPECFRRIVEIDRAQSGKVAKLEVARERRTWRRFAEIACSARGGGRNAGAIG